LMTTARIRNTLLHLWLIAIALLLAACSSDIDSETPDNRALAEQFLRGVYGGNPAVVDELAAEDIVISYPVFQEIFGAPGIRGRDAVKKFVIGFSQRWADPQVTIHEAISEGNSVALVWSFSALSVGSEDNDGSAVTPRQAWGGITVYRFNAAGKIAVEIGEESTPGPAARLAAATGNR